MREKHLTVTENRCTPWNTPDKIRIITFYSSQVLLIQNLLKKANIKGVLVATVDSSQGCESDIVIVSFVRSRESTQRHTIGFLKDERRINVAITRARYQLVCIGNAYGTLYKEEKGAIRELIQNAIDRDCILSRSLGESKLISTSLSDNDCSSLKLKRPQLPLECEDRCISEREGNDTKKKHKFARSDKLNNCEN